MQATRLLVAYCLYWWYAFAHGYIFEMTVVVMMRQPMWETIDGETLLTTLDDLANVLPDTARIRVAGAEIVVADYALWKRLVRACQSKRPEANHV